MIKSIILAFVGLLGLQNLAAQKTGSPMVAYRKDLVWHFYDSQNQLMFANPLIAPHMIDGYVGGYARVRAALNFRKDATPIITPALIDTKGIFMDLDLPAPDSVSWRIIDLVKINAKEQAVQVMNYSNGTTSFINSKNKIVPATSLYHTQYLGEGLVAGFGALPLVMEEEPKYNASFVELNDFEIWNISRGEKISSIKAQQLGQVSNGVMPAKKGDKWGFVNTKGKWLCAPKFVEIGQATIVNGEVDMFELDRTLVNGLIPAREENDYESPYGLIDQNGTWLVKPKYLWLIHINPHCWLGMTLEYDVELLNNGGKPLKVQPTNSLNTSSAQIAGYETVGMNSPILLLNFKDEVGLHIYNSATNKITYSCKDCTLLPLEDNTVLAQTKDKQILVDAEGKILATLRPPTECIYEASRNGLIGFKEAKTQKYGYIDRAGKVVIAPTLPQAVDLVTPDFLYYFDGESHIFLDRTGKIIRKDAVDDNADWNMMTPLQGEGWSFMNN